MKIVLSNYPIGKNVLSFAKHLMTYHKENPHITEYPCPDFKVAIHHHRDVQMPHWIWGEWFDFFDMPKLVDKRVWIENKVDWNEGQNHSLDLRHYVLATMNVKPEILKAHNKIVTIGDTKKDLSKMKKISCHFRRGDAWQSDPSKKWCHQTQKIFDDKLSTADAFFAWIQQYDPNEYYLYFASDSIEHVVKEFLELTKDYTITYSAESKNTPKTAGPPDGHLENLCARDKDAAFHAALGGILDLYNMIGSDVFIGPTNISAFANCAAHLVSAKSDTTIIDIKAKIDRVRGQWRHDSHYKNNFSLAMGTQL